MYMVFWVEIKDQQMATKSRLFPTSEFNKVLNFMGALRKRQRDDQTVAFVSMSSEHPDCIGSPGVDSVEDGKTPDGHDYEWTKQHRGGPPLPKE